MCIYFIGVILSLYLSVLVFIHKPETISKHKKGTLQLVVAIISLLSWGYLLFVFGARLIKTIRGK